MPSCVLLRNIFGRFWAGVICLSLLFPCTGQLVKYMLKCVCIVCGSFTGLSCTGSWGCSVWPGIRDPLQAVGVTCGVSGSGDPLEQPCVLPAILEQQIFGALLTALGFTLSSHENSRITGWAAWAVRLRVEHYFCLLRAWLSIPPF